MEKNLVEGHGMAWSRKPFLLHSGARLNFALSAPEIIAGRLWNFSRMSDGLTEPSSRAFFTKHFAGKSSLVLFY